MSRLEQLQKLADASPDDPLAHYAVALEYASLERYDDAIAAFERALRADANYVAAYYHKARTEIKAGKHDAGRATLKIGIELASAAGDARTTREMRDLLDTVGQ